MFGKFLRQLPVALCFLLLSPFPVSSQGRQESPLADTQWQVVSIGGSGLQPGNAVTLQFDRRDGGGFAGCNEFRFDYSVRDDSIEIDGIISTQRACMPDEILEQEAHFLEMIRGTQRFRRRGNRLLLYSDQSPDRNAPSERAAHVEARLR